MLVGQSLGGFSASWAARRLPATAIVLLNAMIPLPGETAGEWWAATGSSQAMVPGGHLVALSHPVEIADALTARRERSAAGR